jgi:phosphatidylglycerophosphatase GEP4
MVQAVNTKAIFTLASVMRRPHLLVPHVSVDTISQLDFVAMQRHAGIRAVIFDKDNTLTAPYASVVHPLAKAGLQQAIHVFGRDNVAILSNSAGTASDDGPDYKDAMAMEASLGLAVIRHVEKKPGGLPEVLQHFHLNGSNDDKTTFDADAGADAAAASHICMIGDRLLTDIVFGNLHGMLTVHTLPLLIAAGGRNNNGRDDDENRQSVVDVATTDNWTARLIRPVENALLYQSWIGQRWLLRNRPAHAHWHGPEVHSLKLVPTTTASKRTNL